mmetsp:Transcript_14733/g.16875  ORF Transcript_14733/g.16875 Transcript_14733/m.16875 type:complete len:306 (-) Transcript_14733:32-949(-)
MRVFLFYEDNEDNKLHKTLKMKLPKSWKSGPISQLLKQFVESYNSSSLGESNALNEDDLHLAIIMEQESKNNVGESDKKTLPSDAILQDVIPDRSNIFVCHGKSITLKEIQDEKDKIRQKALEYKASTVQCTRFGCKTRFPKGGPYPSCVHHIAPPVFHETAKFWSCCPNKKVYDWNDFENIQGCRTGICTDVKEVDQKQFLGGTDLRAQNVTTQLKSIDDFNKVQQAGGAEAKPVLDRLERIMIDDLGIEKELYDQVVDSIRKKALQEDSSRVEAELLEEIKTTLGSKIKATMKAIAVENLRIS